MEFGCNSKRNTRIQVLHSEYGCALSLLHSVIRCGLPLEDAASLNEGIGPVCRKKDNRLLAVSLPANVHAARLHFGESVQWLHRNPTAAFKLEENWRKRMTTKVYGSSDDLIEFEGDIHGEVGFFSEEEGCLLVFDDGTALVAQYGKPGGLAIWSITVLVKGPLFDRIDVCETETEDNYSDVAVLKDGAKLAFAAQRWERVK